MAATQQNDETIDRRVRVQGQPVDSYPELAPEAGRGEVLRITVVGEEVLHREMRSAVEFGTPELAKLIDDMFLSMYVAEGVGLAANQVGVDLKLFVYDCPDEDGVRHVGHVLNPVLDPLEGEERHLVDEGEGCLSVPGASADLARPDHAVVHGVDQFGEAVAIEGFGYFARCLQHETDHLYGHLYIDRLGKRDRKRALKEMEESRDEVFARREERAKTLAADARS
jgi:peptide deformylase